MDLLEFERKLYNENITLIAGVDEVGRGPLVGPVVACAVILPVNYVLDGLNDSKKLSEKKRDKFFDIINKEAISIGIGVVTPQEIDEINIYAASKKAMMIAIDNLNVKPQHVLTDAMPLNIGIPVTSIIKGDMKSLSIAAASVIAKVTRDKMMYEMDLKYPEYGYKKHKGYPTKMHIENVNKYGIHKDYRFTFKPISDLINKGGKNDSKN